MADLAWVTGLYEGGGCFSADREQPKVTLNMTDRDVVQAVCDWMNAEYPPVAREHGPGRKEGPLKVRECKPRAGRKQQFRLEIQGRRALAFMQLVRDRMFSRRKERIDGLLRQWGNNPRFKYD